MSENMVNIIELDPQPAKQPQRPKFTTNLTEKILSVAIFPIAFLYLSFMYAMNTEQQVYFGVFAVLLLIVGEIMFWNIKRSWESIVFLVLTLLCLAPSVFPFGNVWETGACMFFTHLFAVYWLMCRSGKLAEDKTSHLFLWDGITGFFVMPFKNFPLVFKTIASIFNNKKKGSAKKFWIVVFALVAGLILFSIALSFLKNSDENYKQLMDTIGDFFKIDLDFDLFFKLFFTPLCAMYLYGLLGGCFRETKPQVQHRGDNIKFVISLLAKVPNLVWIILIGLFSIFYIMYFVMQGSYLFGAFGFVLPQEFTYSEYARKGFSEMCSVMIVNFIVLWLAIRTSDKISLGIKVACTALTAESILFSVIAFLKLYMYINAYGFTPLRVQSMWLVAVLFYACICVLLSMLSGKKTARAWFIGSAAALAVTCMI